MLPLVACAPAPVIVHGIDVSYYDDVTDWNAAHEAGIEFAFIRVADGTQFQDPQFASYWAGARAAGVLRGAYQFFRPEQDPIAQADLLLQMMGPLGPGDLPPVIDVEVADGRSPAAVATAVHKWVDHVAAAIGKPPIVYTGLYAWTDLTGGANVPMAPLWIAQYTSAACPDVPAPWTAWTFWQTTDSGSTAGISGNLDLDVFAGSLDDLRALAGLPPSPPGGSGSGGSNGSDVPEDPAGSVEAGCAAGRGDASLLVLAAIGLVARRRARYCT